MGFASALLVFTAFLARVSSGDSSHLIWPYNGHGVIRNGLPAPFDEHEAVQASACPNKKRCKSCGDGCDKHKTGACEGTYYCSNQPATSRLFTVRPTTRERILKRAVGWLVNTYHYADRHNIETCHGDEPWACPSHEWIADCIGFVYMAWEFNPTHHPRTPDANLTIDIPNIDREADANANLPAYVPGQDPKHPYRQMYKVPQHECQIGDMIAEGGHAVLFMGWAGGAKAPKHKMRIWQMGGGAGKVNIAVKTVGKRYKCFRRSGVKPLAEDHSLDICPHFAQDWLCRAHDCLWYKSSKHDSGSCQARTAPAPSFDQP